MGPKKFGFEKFLCLKNFLSENNLGRKKFYRRTFSSTKIMGPKSLVKIGPVTAEILMIWANVARAYVAWTNVTVKVG